jgi:hypothetical protein
MILPDECRDPRTWPKPPGRSHPDARELPRIPPQPQALAVPRPAPVTIPPDPMRPGPGTAGGPAPLWGPQRSYRDRPSERWLVNHRT